MAAKGVKISQMDATNTLAGDELVPIVQNGSNKSATISKIKEGLATEAWVIEAINNAGGKTVVVTELPTKGDVNKIYLIPNESSRANDVYDEYIYLITEQKTGWEFLGNKHVDVNLKDYYTKAEVNKAIEGVEGRTTSALALKVDKVDGKQLSTNDYTTSEKNKLQSIAANANNYTHPTTAGNKHLPAGGTVGQVLVNSGDGTGEWKDVEPGIDLTGLEDIYSYGVEWDSTVADPTLTRIGNPLLHKSLPVQSQYKGCVANGAKVNYYLDPNDWSKKADGTPSVLDGTDGTVRVHIPKFYGKSGVEGNKRWVRISTVKCDDTWVEIPEMLLDAYRSTVNQTGNKAVSVVNTTAQFRGGSGNRTANDTYLSSDKFRSDLGKPRTNISRANMRTYATNAGSEVLCYEYYKWIFYWAWVIEYATFDSQATYNAELTADGYHQGGLGPGITYWNKNADGWSGYNGTYPITPCGYCNDIGNFTGIKELVIPETVVDESTTVPTKTFKVPRWRGFDNPFGDIWTNLDGVILERTAANQPSSVYTTSNSSAFGDDNTAKGKMTVVGKEIASDGYTKDFDLGSKGEIIPSVVGGSATTYMCDYHWCNAASTSLRTLIVGGGAHDGGGAGFGYFYSNDEVGYVFPGVGFRTLTRITQ